MYKTVSSFPRFPVEKRIRQGRQDHECSEKGQDDTRKGNDSGAFQHVVIRGAKNAETDDRGRGRQKNGQTEQTGIWMPDPHDSKSGNEGERHRENRDDGQSDTSKKGEKNHENADGYCDRHPGEGVRKSHAKLFRKEYRIEYSGRT